MASMGVRPMDWSCSTTTHWAPASTEASRMGREVLIAMAHGAELEDAVAFLFLHGGADELVHVGGLALLVEVLEMDHRRAAGVLLDVGGGILAGDLHPAGVHLGLEQVGGDGVVDVVQGVAAVGHLHELKVVVVIERLDAVGLAGFADLLEELHVPLELGGGTGSYGPPSIGRGWR